MDKLSIGEFARACGLTPKALRLYDELGLLPPASVHPDTGYRSYERSQLARAQLVSWLRGLGMPLARIRVVCELPGSAAAADVASYWRQVEADTAARGELAAFLIERLSQENAGMLLSHKEFEVHHAMLTECGPARESNQDAAYAGTGLAAVADGFGAPPTAETASVVAVRALERADSEQTADKLAEALSAAVAEARSAVHRFVASEPAHEKAGTTLTAMLWSGDRFALGHIGDSRAYRMRGGELVQLTHDHTFVQSLVDEGRLTPAEAATHPQRTRLLRALCRDDTSAPDLHLRMADPGDRYLLCSKGVHSVLTETQLADVLGAAGDPHTAVVGLRTLIEQAGAPDNLSCVVTDVTKSQ
jgi:protein phosphatase